MSLKKIETLKRKIELAKKKASQAEGAKQQVAKVLKSEYGCKSLKDATSLLSSMKKKREELSEKFEKALADFEAEWGEDE